MASSKSTVPSPAKLIACYMQAKVDAQYKYRPGIGDQQNLLDMIAECDQKKIPLYLNGREFTITEPLTLPEYGIIGPGAIVGAPVVLRRNRKKFVAAGKLTFNVVRFEGVQYLDTTAAIMICTDHLYIDGGTYEISPGVFEAAHGSFWNRFGAVEGNIKIWADHHSVNFNDFDFVRGYIHIYGGHDSALVNEVDLNNFAVVDSTMRNLTAADGTSGWAILNESARNQRNKIGMWYSEGSSSGNNAIRGAWQIGGQFFDGPSSPYSLPEWVHVLNNAPNSNRASRDFFAGNPQVNSAVGGLWDVLDFDNGARPLCMGSAGSVTTEVRAEPTDPCGIGYSFGGVSASSFRSLRINLKHSKTGLFGIFLYAYMPNGHAGIELLRSGQTANRICNDIGPFHDCGGGWRLYRLSGFCRNDGQDETLVIWFNTSGTVNREIRISGVWASPNHACFLPSKVPDNQVRGVATGTPTVNAPWAPVGMVINNTAESTFGAAYAWVKHAATVYGALRSSEPFRGAGTVSVPISTKTQIMRFTVGGYNTVLSGDIDLVFNMTSASPYFRDGAGRAKLSFSARKNSDTTTYQANLQTAAFPWVATGDMAAPVVTLEVESTNFVLYVTPPTSGGVISVAYVITSDKSISLI